MKELLALNPLGGYLATGSLVHELDPRAKLLIVILSLITLVVIQSITVMVMALGLIVATSRLARIPFRHAIQPLKHAVALLVFLGILQVLVIPQNDTGIVLFEWWRVVVTTGDLAAAALTIARLCCLILLLSLFTSVMSLREIAHGTGQLLRPLQRMGLPVHEFSLVFTLAVRFVPVLSMETDRIIKAQVSRGGEIGSGRGFLFRRVRAVLPLIIPLFLTALRRSETLILAMESRCYVGGSGRSHLVRYHAGGKDYLAACVGLLVNCLFVAAALLDLDGRILQIIKL